MRSRAPRQIDRYSADYAYVPQTGRTVLEGSSAQPSDDEDVQRIYLGLETEGH